MDECDLETHNCHEHADCTNTDGSYTCGCKTGYTGDGTTCNLIQTWHGETDVAGWSFIGQYRSLHGSENAMFDGEYSDSTMFHSDICEGTDYGGFIVTFENSVALVDIIIHTRQECCRDRYNNVCLYGDGVQIVCTPADLADPGDTLNFNDYVTTDVVAQEYMVNWENDQCAQVEELFVEYAETA